MSESTSSSQNTLTSKTGPIALIDGDILAYRIGFASEDVNEALCRARVDEFLSEMLMDLDVKEYEGYLTGKGNFRDAIAVTAPYKGNRSGAKPIHFDFIRRYLQDDWGFTLVNGEEADDAIAIRATELGEDGCIICSIDKDFLQIPGNHYNFVKREKLYVSPGDGLRSFYEQLLTGDRVDNIIGLRGIGPIKARKLLHDCDTEQSFYARAVEAYAGDLERLVENGKLLWLRRVKDQIWEPPK